MILVAGSSREVGLWRSCRPTIAAVRRELRVARAAAPWKRPAAEGVRRGRQIEVGSLFELDEHADPLAEYRVGHRDGRRHGDRGMGCHRFFDLDRADVLSAAQDEVRRAAGEGEVALVVQFADVAHPHPAVLGEQLVVVGAIQIAEAQRRSAARRLAATGLGDVAVAVEQPHLHLRHDPAGGAQPAVQRVGDRGRTEHAGLVGPVELQNRDAGQLLELGRLRVGQRFAAGEDHPQAVRSYSREAESARIIASCVLTQHNTVAR